MSFRVRASLYHLLISACVLALVVGGLYFGWYYWPGWYLVGASGILGIMVLVDVGLGPLATLVVADPAKARAEFRRDLTIIVVIQAIALAYGTWTLWAGRPLFYALSMDRLHVVQASSISEEDWQAAQAVDGEFQRKLLRRPQWVWAPLPVDADEKLGIMASAVSGGGDVVNMPKYFRKWDQGLDELRAQLKPLAEMEVLSSKERTSVEAQLRESSIGRLADQAAGILLWGSSKSAVAVFDRRNLELVAFIAVKP